MKQKIALITGITGQDGSYLAEFLLNKGYKVFGIQRRASTFNTDRINHIFHNSNFATFYGDLTDTGNVIKIINDVKPDEIYNLAAQSHVRVSFDMPEYTANTDGLGSLRIFEAVRNLGLKTKIYQAGSSEMFGSAKPPQNEKTIFQPRSPYACAKVFAHDTAKLYRDAYGMFICNGILFNHESPRRGETFVTRKVVRGLARIKLGLDEKLSLGNLEAKRDWGYAPDFVELMWLMLQQDNPDDYVVATGETHSVRAFVEEAVKLLGFDFTWKGEGVNEKGVNQKTGKSIIEINPRYFRPTEVDVLIGDYTKAKKKLGWEPKVKFKELVKIMVDAEFEKMRLIARDYVD